MKRKPPKRAKKARLLAENQRLLAACRKAVLALAHAANKNPMYVDSYIDLSTAIERAVKANTKGKPAPSQPVLI